MEAAQKRAAPDAMVQTTTRPDRKAERDMMIGKTIFYSTVAVALWFFYWLNGINCPC
jgi:hypothetical protein